MQLNCAQQMYELYNELSIVYNSFYKLLTILRIGNK